MSTNNIDRAVSDSSRLMRKADMSKIMIVDDESCNISVLSEILKGKYEIVAALNAETALDLVRQDRMPDLILLDIMMPDMDGYELCRAFKDDKLTEHIPVIFVTAMIGEEDEAKGFSVGGVDYITKPVSPSIVRSRVATHITLSKRQISCDLRVDRQMGELIAAQKEAVYMLAKASHYNDISTGVHAWRMAEYSKALAKAAGWSQLQQNLILMAASLHDTGKVGLPLNILTKKGVYTEQEVATMRKHTLYGHQILSTARTPLFQMASDIALYHHERWAGGGYPHNLRETNIPEAARIASIADVFDALTVRQDGRKVWTSRRAMEYICTDNGHFDPQLALQFKSIEDEVLSIREKWARREKGVLFR